jgi:hypothetical protein
MPLVDTKQIKGTLDVTNGGTGTPVAFTAGSVIFAGVSGVYTQDNANFFWDNSAKRLGIGTATPGLALDVVGQIRGVSGTSTFAHTFARQTTVTGTALAALDIQADIPGAEMTDGFGPRLFFRARDTGGTLEDQADISAARVSADNSADLYFRTYSGGVADEVMRLTSTGRVGIQTDAPIVALHVVGEEQITSANVPLRINRTGLAAAALGGFMNLTARADTAVDMIADFGGALNFHVQDDGSGPNLITQITGRRGSTDLAGAITFLTATAGGTLTETVRITEQQRVGIGESAPASIFHLTGEAPIFTATSTNTVSGLRIDVVGLASGVETLFRVQDAGTTRLQMMGAGSTRFSNGTVLLPAVAFLNDIDTGIFLPTVGDIAIATGGSERVRVTAAGRVGVGIDAPASVLHISDAAPIITATCTNAASGLLVDVLGLDGDTDILLRVRDTATVRFQIMRDGLTRFVDGTAALPALSFINDSNTGIFRVTTDVLAFSTTGLERMRIDASGYADIGGVGSEATVRLRVSDTAQSVLRIKSTNADSLAELRITNDAISWVFRNDGGAADRLLINAPGSQQCVVQNGSGGLISTDVLTNTTAKVGRFGCLHYTTTEEPVFGLVINPTASDNEIEIGGGTVVGNAATVIKFYTAANTTTVDGTERMRIHSSGNVSIGSGTDNGFNLEVTGTAKITGKLTVLGSLDPTDIILSGGGTAHFQQWGNGTTAGLSAAGTGRIIYNDTAKVFQYSADGGAYTTFAPGVGGTGTTNTIAKFTASTTLGNSDLTENGTAFTYTLPMRGGNGSLSSAAFGFSGSTNTGVYRTGGGGIGFTVAGSDAGTLFQTSASFGDSSGVTVAGRMNIASNVNDSFQVVLSLENNLGNEINEGLDIQFRGSNGVASIIRMECEDAPEVGTGGGLIFFTGTNSNSLSERLRIDPAGGLLVNLGRGSTHGAGTITVATDIYKNATAYTNPDFVFEKYYTGDIRKFSASPGADTYQGLRPLVELERFVAENWHLPSILRRESGMFDRADMLLESVEELHLYIFQQQRKIDALEARLAQLEEN